MLVSRDVPRRTWDEAIVGLSTVDGMALLGRLVDVVARLHRTGTFHGEIEPTTVRVDDGGQVFVAMPGLATLIRPTRTEGPWWEPELSLGAAPTPSSDVYGLGMAAASLDGAELAPSGRRARRAVARSRASSVRFDPSGADWRSEMVSAVNLALSGRDVRPTNATVFRAILRLQPPRAARSTHLSVPASTDESTQSELDPNAKRSQLAFVGEFVRRKRRFASAVALVAVVVVAGNWWLSRPYIPTCGSATDCPPGMRCESGLCAIDGMVFVPPGRFEGGVQEGPRVHLDDPYSAVLRTGFYIDETEVTQGEFAALTGASPSWFSECGSDCPVESVNWFEAIEFANLRSQQEGLPRCYRAHSCTGEFGGGCTDLAAGDTAHNCRGDYGCTRVEFAGIECRGYRLPTEVEWEYAARGGTRSSTYAGTFEYGSRAADELEILSGIARTAASSEVEYSAWPCSLIDGPNDDEQCGPGTVGSLEPNAYGLYDMLGNVGEWTTDGAVEQVGRRSGWRCLGRGEIGPNGDRTCVDRVVVDRVVHDDQTSARVLRGGAFFHTAPNATASTRNALRWEQRFVDVGFRLVRSAVPPGE